MSATPITRICTLMPSMPRTVIRLPTRTCTACANDASMTAPSGAAGRSQLPATSSGADMAGSVDVMVRSSTGDFTALCSSVADAAW